MAVGGVVMWAAGRMDWMTVESFDDKSGTATHQLAGSTWSTELAALAFVVIVAAIAAFALRALGRRVVGGIAAVAAIAASWSPLAVVAGSPSLQRAQGLLTAGATTGQATQARISQWATVESISVHPTGPYLAFAGCAIALIGGLVVAVKPGTDSAKRNAYEATAARRERLSEDVAKIKQEKLTTGDAPRVMWDALDADIDPTA
ncbi:hypothetical protein CAQU_08155 [Corynebacterium aquilae DSM 44791]|uniref:TIGR02234 family membrane protein n=2 Tax=Corynebacterium aquilae TaxID=203263 RepID=A0A1L7CGS3_9CORY|nr:hypothetical protein CAQU_08155 [Corynebacterium aquilae DSM 44791]